MLRMDGFTYAAARSPEHAVALFSEVEGARYIAGGTDLLPNVKQRIVRPTRLIGLSGALARGWREEGGRLTIHAGTRLSELARLPQIPALAEAAGLVAGPQIRNMGTLGGNILLDTRCLFYNQTEFWRRSLGYCLKAEGDWCHVINGPKTCVATQSADTVPLLLAMDASIRLLSAAGTRELRMRDLYRFDGKDHLKIEPGELLTDVLVPLPPAGSRATYRKLRTRGGIDFPQLGLAVCGTFEGTGPGAVATSLEIIVGAINPQPKPIRKLEGYLDQPLTDDLIDAIADQAAQQTRPVGSVQGEPAWRRHMAGVFVKRALRDLRG